MLDMLNVLCSEDILFSISSYKMAVLCIEVLSTSIYDRRTCALGMASSVWSHLCHRHFNSNLLKSFCNRLLTIQGIIFVHGKSKKDCLASAATEGRINKQKKVKTKMPGFEPGTSCIGVMNANHYTMTTCYEILHCLIIIF